MKTAKVVALYKGAGCKSHVDNYRPISLLPVISKIIEKYMYLKLVSHPDKNGVTYPKQFRFHKGHSTTDAYLVAVAETLNSFQKSFSLLSVFVDLRKAFDTVNHSIILAKLEKLGVWGVALDWFRSYLCNQVQYVTYQGVDSDKKGLPCGVPQGSLLGVILFQIQINDLKSCLRYSDSILYVDDTMIYVFGRNLHALKANIQYDLNALSRWLSLNKLLLNAKKTKSLLFSRVDNVNVKLFVNGDQQIQSVCCFKFLGFYLDVTLSFEHHCHHLYETLLKSIFIIRKLSTFLLELCLHFLYYAYYYSRLSYGVHIWFPLFRENLKNRLILLHKQIVRAICRKHPRTHCMPLFKKMRILTLHDLIYLENVKLMHRIEIDCAPKPVINQFDRAHHSYETCGGRFVIPQYRLSQYNSSFLVKAIIAWDQLPVRHRAIPSVKQFSKSVKTELVLKY